MTSTFIIVANYFYFDFDKTFSERVSFRTVRIDCFKVLEILIESLQGF